MNSNSRRVQVPANAVKDFLAGRPIDPRVKFTTGINKGKRYPSHSPRTWPAEPSFVEADALTDETT